MSDQKNFFGDLAKLLAGIIVSKIPELAEDAIEAIFHQHKDEICEKADPVMRAQDDTGGLPPDPTHPKP